MRVAIRVDASAQIGTGHLRRCAAIADALRELGASVAWVSRELGIPTLAPGASGDLRLVLPKRDSPFKPQNGPAHAAWAEIPWHTDADETIAVLRGFAPDWIILDHYAFDSFWIDKVRAELSAKCCVIDDIADRSLSADVIVDHNLDGNDRVKYASVAPAHARLLGGTRYALLSAAFREARRHEVRDEVRSIGIFLGGTDPGQFTSVALRACREEARFDGAIEVVATTANPKLATLVSDCETWSAQLLTDLPDLAEFFARHDIQIGAGGGAALERCRIGAPSVGLVCALNQKRVIDTLAARGALHKAASNGAADIGAAVSALLNSAEARRKLSEAARALVDGRGARRVAVAIAADSVALRIARPNDAELVYDWRNDPRTRRHSRNPGDINRDEHMNWWQLTLDDTRRRLLIASCGTVPVGTLRFDIDDRAAEVSIYLDPDLTGLGLGVSLLRAGQHWIATDSPTLTHLRAEILEANRPSAAAFGSAGFVQVAPTRWRSEIAR